MCVCSLSYAARNALAPYCTAICGLFGCTIFFHYIINGKIPNFIKIRPMRAEFFPFRQKDVRTEMMKLTIAVHILWKGLTRNKQPCPQRYSNPGSQQSSRLRSNALDRTATGIDIAELSCVFSWNYSQLSTATKWHHFRFHWVCLTLQVVCFMLDWNCVLIKANHLICPLITLRELSGVWPSTASESPFHIVCIQVWASYNNGHTTLVSDRYNMSQISLLTLRLPD